MMDITQQAFNNALKEAFEAGVESERNRIARIISDTSFDAQSGLTPGLLSKAVMVIAKRVFGEVNV